MKNKKASHWHHRLFHYVHNSTLIYNTCWEDPECDRQLMSIGEDAQIVMLTSAGCNALEYLLDNPQSIHCVDMNYRQNALLELKLALFRHGCYATLLQFFKDGKHPNAQEIYCKSLRDTMPVFAQSYWDRKIVYFSGKGIRRSFYYRGASGLLAFIITSYLQSRPAIKKQVMELMNADSLSEQAELYSKIENKIFTRQLMWLIDRQSVQVLAGVPVAQTVVLRQQYPEGVGAYMRNCIRRVFTSIPVKQNYFYQVYILGKYPDDCLPAYLKEENFETIKSRVHKIRTYSVSLTRFFLGNPGSYSHFVLLDHQDWLANHQPDELDKEWRLILDNASLTARILMRSAAGTINFVPSFAHEHINFLTPDQITPEYNDRVGTYAGTLLGSVRA